MKLNTQREALIAFESSLAKSKLRPLTKAFKTTAETLTDNPEKVMEEILAYLTEVCVVRGETLVRSMEIEIGVDEETFAPVIYLRMYPTDRVNGGYDAVDASKDPTVLKLKTAINEMRKKYRGKYTGEETGIL